MNLNIRQLANKTYTSTSAIVRLCQKLGLQGYKEFKIFGFLNLELKITRKRRCFKDDDLDDIVNKLSCHNIDAIGIQSKFGYKHCK